MANIDDSAQEVVQNMVGRNILNHLDSVVAKVVRDQLGTYNGVVAKCVNATIDKHETFIRKSIEEGFAKALNAPNFQDLINDAIAHKMCRNLAEQLGGEIEKRIKAVRSDPRIRNTIDSFLVDLAENGIDDMFAPKPVTIFMSSSVRTPTSIKGVPVGTARLTVTPEDVWEAIGRMTDAPYYPEHMVTIAKMLNDGQAVKYFIGDEHDRTNLFLHTNRTDKKAVYVDVADWV